MQTLYFLPMNLEAVLWTLGSVLAVSMISFSGLFLLSLKEKILKSMLLYLVSFATGALFANVFAHLLPEIIEESADLSQPFLLIFAGILGSFAIEALIHWHHCHNIDCAHHDVRPVGKLILIGDGAHNFLDGILIAGAYLVDIRLGIATTIAVILHEIPQEIGDFSVLLHSGYSRSRALTMNFLSALAAVAGAVVLLFIQSNVAGIEQILLPLTAGNFLYIAGTDLMPELHRQSHLGRALLQVLCIIAGAALIYGIATGNDPHETREERTSALAPIEVEP